MVETLRSLKDKCLCPPIIGHDSVVEEVIPNYDPKSKTKQRVGILKDDGSVEWIWDDEKAAAKELLRL